MRYRVTIEYHEPIYDQRVGRKRGPFVKAFSEDAESPQEAERIAREQFAWLARESSVSWGREILNCVVRADPENGEEPGLTAPQPATPGPSRTGSRGGRRRRGRK